MFALFDETNKYIAESKPWDIAKTGDKKALYAVLAPVMEILRITTYMLSPIMPVVCQEILTELGTPEALKVKFNEFTQWGYATTLNAKYKNRKFFDRIEL